jgi:outer membrane receptor protein involved in Fe transport
MKELLLIYLMAIVSISLFAQGTITGRVDNQNKEVIPFANVSVHQKDTVVTGTVTNSDGRFVITNLKDGVYKLTVSFIGFKNYEKEFVIGNLNKTLDFGNITLNKSTLEISDVTVVGQKRTVSADLDKKSYSTTDIIANANGSVLDAMKQLPGITIDQESKVQLRGSDKVIVLIDGKQSALTGFGNQKGLENIPASQIESIEIINNPSAKYDAAGMAGIVNIKFKQQQNSGLNGDAGFSFGIGQLTKRKADLPTGMPSYSMNPKFTPSLNLNYKINKINLFLQSYWINQEKLPNNEFSTRHYPTGDMLESQVAENRSQNHYNIKLGFDLYISDNQTLTIFGLYDYEWHIDTTKVWYFKNRDYNSPVRKYGFNESEGTGFTNGTIQHKIRFAQPGHELKSQYLFTKGWEDETYNLFQDATADFPAIKGDRTHIIAPEYIHQISTDYIKPLSFGRFESGMQTRFRNMPINYTMSRAQGNTALIFDYGDWSKWSENLAAVYINLVSEFKRWDIEAGLRGEYTNVVYKFAPNQYFKDNRYDYFKLFPNVRLTLKADQVNRISLFYNRRIDRPGEDILRIFPKYDDPELLKIGNPKLRPQLTNSVELAYRLTWKGGSLFAAAYYKNISNYYTRIYIQDPMHDNITIKGYSNIPRSTNTGLEINVDQNMTKIWKVNLNGNIYRNKIFGYTEEIDFPTPVNYEIRTQSDNPWFVKMNSLLTISPRVKCELSSVYFSDKAIAQGEELSRWGVDFGLRTLWLKNKLEMNLSANDIFNRMGIRQHINQGNGYSTDYQNFYETQVLSIGSKFKF